MDHRTFEDALDRHGADIRGWPADLAAQAEALVASSIQARRLLDEAERLRAGLDDALSARPAPPGLKTRLLANLPQGTPWLEWWTLRTWRPALALVPLAIGLGVGINVANGSEAENGTDDLLVALFDPTELDRLALPGDETSTEP